MVLLFKIQIRGIENPPVWRRVLVNDTLTFYEFHLVIQSAFGWENEHLFQFAPQGCGSFPVISLPSPDDVHPVEHADGTKLSKYFKKEKDTLTYIYDLGDDWVHDITLEKITFESIFGADCVEGGGTCPPEDCGGPLGYENLKKILADKNHPEHEDMKMWLGLGLEEVWDPDAFCLTCAQNALDQLDDLLDDFEDWEEAFYAEPKVEVIPVDVPATTEPPVFTHPEMELLYRNGMDIDRSILHEILLLPRETLVADLEKMLIDSIARCKFFALEGCEETQTFPLHALTLLSHLEAEEALDSLILFLSQSEGLLDFWLNDYLTESMWIVIYQMGKGRLDKLQEFIFTPNKYLYSHTAVIQAVGEMSGLSEQKKKESIEWLQRCIAYLLEHQEDKNLFSKEVFTSLVEELASVGDRSLKSYIKMCCDTELCCTDEDLLLAELETPKEYMPMFDSIDSYYDKLENWCSDDTDWSPPSWMEPEVYQPYIAPVKVGRNDPCPCGSGKKYKKCCGNN